MKSIMLVTILCMNLVVCASWTVEHNPLSREVTIPVNGEATIEHWEEDGNKERNYATNTGLWTELWAGRSHTQDCRGYIGTVPYVVECSASVTFHWAEASE